MRRAAWVLSCFYVLGVGIVLLGDWSAAHAAVLPMHDYALNGDLNDQFGGPALSSLGGAITPTGYQFSSGKGLKLSGAISPENYSLEMQLRLDDTSSWRKLIDFKNLTADQGLYNYSTALYFYSEISGGNGSFANGKNTHVVLTRDSSSKMVAGYVDGNLVFEFSDTNGIASFNATGNVAHFFVDDTTTSGSESGSGFVDYIRVYNNPLSASEVTELFALVPEPASMQLTLVAVALGAAGLWRRRRSTQLEPTVHRG